MADQKTTDAAATALMKTFYRRKLLDRLEPKGYLHQFGVPEPIPMSNGKTIEFTGYRQGYPILSDSAELTSSQTYLSAYTVTATLIQRHEYVKFSTLLKQTSWDPKVNGAVEWMADKMAKTVEIYLREVVVGKVGTAARSSNSNSIQTSTSSVSKQGVITGNSAQRTHHLWSPFPSYSNQVRLSSSATDIAVMAGSAITVNQIRNGVTNLLAKDVEAFDNGGFVLYCHTFVADVLMQDPKWANWNKPQNSKETFWKNEIGKIHNTRIVQSNMAFRYVYSSAPLTTASGAFNASLLLGKGAFGVSEITGVGSSQGFEIFIKNPGPNSTNDPTNLISTVGGKMTMAGAILNKSAALLLITTDKVVSGGL